ncbi:PREDICTED: protein I'm not dead yet-like [Bactrocera latifrons]|uniref:protein I'm not dead yet-like n=1 Tax=Bactrocera latifrons TaxID=174628 RepID=UPI0008DE39BB|nr:PREDICTED: protein I'm not dead yet-like [Bactrocera latifrons]
MEDEKENSCPRMYGHLCKFHWRGIVLIVTPFLLLPIIIPGYERPLRCLYVFSLMSIYWLTTAVPLQVTGLLPFVLLPFLGLMDSTPTCKQYFTVPLAIFIGGAIVGLSIESSNLGKRVALGLLTVLGVSPKRIIITLILTTGFFSMWMQNTITTAMMLPLVKAVLDEFEAGGLKIKEDKKPEQDEENRESSHIATGYYLAVCYSATIGGCASLIGTSTNIATKGQYENLFVNTTDIIDFPKALAYNIPWVLVALVLLYFTLLMTHFGLFRPKSVTGAALSSFTKSSNEVTTAVKQKFEDMGPMSIHEIQVAIISILMIFLLTFQSPGIITGWADPMNKKGFIKGATPMIAVVVMLFYFPARYTFFKFCCGKGPFPSSAEKPLLSWKYVNNNFPWGIVFVLGSGFALSKSFIESGLSLWLADKVSTFNGLPLPVLQLFSLLVSAFLTTFTLNTGVCNIVVPIIAEIARNAQTHPLNLIYPAGLGCCVAFLLPISTPPNALVAEQANISWKKMFVGGLIPTFTTIILIYLNSLSWHFIVFPATKDYPAWADLQKK